MAFTLKINGTPHKVDVDGDTPLLWVLRDVLGMTGTKFGCGQALCGACTVHVDGAATRSCITTVDSIGESAITTIEAIQSAFGTNPKCRSAPPRSGDWGKSRPGASALITLVLTDGVPKLDDPKTIDLPQSTTL